MTARYALRDPMTGRFWGRPQVGSFSVWPQTRPGRKIGTEYDQILTGRWVGVATHYPHRSRTFVRSVCRHQIVADSRDEALDALAAELIRAHPRGGFVLSTR